AHLLVEGKKMSKALGNFYTLRDLLARGWSGREVRYALISTHYRDPLNFTFEGLQAARSALQRMDAFLLKLQETIGEGKTSSEHPTARALSAQFEAALDDDLNISGALGSLFEFIREANKRSLLPDEAAGVLAAWRRFDEVLGFGIPNRLEAPADVLALVEEREAARKVKNYQRADEIRGQLAARGWAIEDTPQGPRLRRR
ncbi:MAG: cysteine--tRNA ligase, partial [Verrucomicrobiae bacterium]|nr:cysteine--tRNA ligase [Verrucomicrobiae bacterium]